MANKELVYLADVRRALLRYEPEAAYTLQGLRRVDAVPAVHGRWLVKQESLQYCWDDVDVYFECSICKSNTFGESPFCPNCGAKMDGDVDEM